MASSMVKRSPLAHTVQTGWDQEATDVLLLPGEVSHLFTSFFSHPYIVA